MKRRATAQLTREGGYEAVPEAESGLASESSPLEIQKRVFYRARRPLRQPQFTDDEKVGFKLKGALLSAEEEKKLLLGELKPVDFLSVGTPQEPQPAVTNPQTLTEPADTPPQAPPERLSEAPSAGTPKSTLTETLPTKPPAAAATPSSVSTVKAKESVPLFSTPLTSPAFKSAGFKSLIEELSKKKSDEVAQTFIQTKTEGTELASPRVVLPNPVESKSVYSTILSVSTRQQECKFASNGADKGPGKLEILCQLSGANKLHTVIFRNGIGSIMYRGVLPLRPKVTPASAALIELAENESNYTELEFTCMRKEEKWVSEKCHVAVPLKAMDLFVEKFEQCKG